MVTGLHCFLMTLILIPANNPNYFDNLGQQQAYFDLLTLVVEIFFTYSI